nr:type II CRISPR-associated endonuclease Cas1 [uncultured Marvinbryantia sp.]
MSWRIIVISKRAKLDLQLGYMVVRSEEITKIVLSEISTILIESTAVSLTTSLLAELARRKVKVIFCDEKRNPQAELVPYYGCHNDTLKIKKQLQWDAATVESIWTRIVSEKISNQALLLRKTGHDECELLYDYVEQLQPGDVTNREGHAAKVYFNALFGKNFSRDDEECVTNAVLNYGYALILSAVNREVSANGYLTQLGLWHDNQFNHFNLSCDLMEPIRIIVDEFVYFHNFSLFETEEKHKVADILNQPVRINNTEQLLINAIKIYVKSVFDALNQDRLEEIRFIEL